MRCYDGILSSSKEICCHHENSLQYLCIRTSEWICMDVQGGAMSFYIIIADESEYFRASQTLFISVGTYSPPFIQLNKEVL